MSDKESGNVNQIIHETAVELAKKKINFKEDDKQNQEKLTLLQLQIREEEEGVNETVRGIYNTIQMQVGNAILPDSLMTECAGYVYDQVKQNGLTSYQEVTVGEAASQEILINALQNTDREIQKVETINNGFGKIVNEFINSKEEKEQIRKTRNQNIGDIFNKSHDKNATKNEKDLATVEMDTAGTDTMEDLGLQFEQLDTWDKKWIVTQINTYKKNGKEKEANHLMSTFGITEEMLNDSNYKILLRTGETENAEQDAEERTINNMASPMIIYLKYEKNISQEEQEKFWKDIYIKLDSDEKDENGNVYKTYKADAIMKALLNCGGIDLKNLHQRKLVDMLEKEFDDPESKFILDGWATEKVIDLAQRIKEKNPQVAKSLLEKYNTKVPVGQPKITLEMLDYLETAEQVENTDKENSELYEKGTIYALKNCFKQKLVTTYSADDLKKNIEYLQELNKIYPQINSQEILIEAIVGLNIELLKGNRERKNQIELFQTHLNRVEKENIPKKIVQCLFEDKDKDSPEFNTPEALEQKKQLFEIVIARDMKASKLPNQELIEQLASIDVNTLQKVLDESLLPKYNDSIQTKVYINAITDQIGKQKEQSGKVLNSEKTLPGSFASGPDALINSKEKTKNQNSKEEPKTKEQDDDEPSL